ncbi:formimidoylglutamase [Parachitinimonas caeni]|uniref:Formimidoylglutamase n=1 Tax=Parachitinimonas caeni TaxID=3031301 RepID=A0ABT7E0Z3_9NEIS|nr:formimidoylglutamase [Parachitinimonas caeni]MDK2125991.1 formimidoylglutamase [Parachitinimonas caeni]
MYQPAEMSIWRGRVDHEEGALAVRWHERVTAMHGAIGPGVALLGFRCDAGVTRNQGRPGAKQGPTVIRQALANMAWHQTRLVHDAGDVHCEDDQLEAAQTVLAREVAQCLMDGHFPIVLGGGHEVAFGSFLGLARFAESQPKPPRIGIINFDAHFDLRGSERPSSGTPFRQIARMCQESGWPFRYCCLGVSEPGNTPALFATARELNVLWRLDDEMGIHQLADSQQQVNAFVESVDWIYLTICLDVLPAAVAPGVSAPAARGVALEVVETLIDQIKQSGKLKMADVAEMNPSFDIDNRTAKVAARLVWRLAR